MTVFNVGHEVMFSNSVINNKKRIREYKTWLEYNNKDIEVENVRGVIVRINPYHPGYVSIECIHPKGLKFSTYIEELQVILDLDVDDQDCI